MRCQKKSYCASWRRIILVLLVAVIVTAPNALAKGPAPKPDFVTTAQDDGNSWNPSWTFATTGILTNSGKAWIVESWTAGGRAWARCRFADTYDSDFYFETVLPTQPQKGKKYDFVLTAGPNGYWTYRGNELVLYEGDWAYGTASTHISKTTVWFDGWKFYYDLIDWKLDGFLIP